MQFDSLRDFLVMEGHGPFVWSAYAITFAVMLALVLVPLWQHRRMLRLQRAALQRRRARAGGD